MAFGAVWIVVGTVAVLALFAVVVILFGGRKS